MLSSFVLHHTSMVQHLCADLLGLLDTGEIETFLGALIMRHSAQLKWYGLRLRFAAAATATPTTTPYAETEQPVNSYPRCLQSVRDTITEAELRQITDPEAFIVRQALRTFVKQAYTHGGGDGAKKPLQLRTICASLAHFGNSASPNAMVTLCCDTGAMVLRASRDIESGEEICFAHDGDPALAAAAAAAAAGAVETDGNALDTPIYYATNTNCRWSDDVD